MSEEAKPLVNEKSKIALIILETAILLGVSGDYFLRQTPWGLNFFLWILAITAGIFTISYLYKKEYFTNQRILLHGAILFFASTFLYRASIPLLIFNVGAIIAVAAVLTLPNLRLNPQISGISHYILGLIWSGINMLVSPFLIVFSDIKWRNSESSSWAKTVFPILKSLVIAVPLLIIFGSLFMAADKGFETVIKSNLNIEIGEIVGHLFLIGFLFWIITGYFRGVFFDTLIPQQLSQNKVGNNADTVKNKWDWRDINSSVLPSSLTLGTIEISLIWGVINLLFLSFVLFQLPYLFGGFDYVQNTENLKLADYARRGFGELMLVTMLVLPLLLVGHWLVQNGNKTAEKVFKVMSSVQIGLLFVIMLSALQRMIVYTGNMGYGLTEERFYPMVLMVTLGVVFVWFVVTILSGMRNKFAWGALWITLFSVGILNILNPQDFIFKTNMRLKQEGRSFDLYYNFRELDDATPAFIESISQFKDKDKCYIENVFFNKIDDLKDAGSQNWNFSRWQNKQIYQDYLNQKGLEKMEYKDCYQLYPNDKSEVEVISH